MDKFIRAKRSEIMARISSANTKPERYARSRFWASGLRYARTKQGLPGSPDLVFPSLQVAVFVHGCFWHGHHCSRAELPSSNRAFWRAKIQKNRRRDAKAVGQLRTMGWHCFQIWQCRLKRDTTRAISRTLFIRARLTSFRR